MFLFTQHGRLYYALQDFTGLVTILSLSMRLPNNKAANLHNLIDESE
jgi:hypothetical protein